MAWTKVAKGWDHSSGDFLIRKLKNGRFSVMQHVGGRLPWRVIANVASLAEAKEVVG